MATVADQVLAEELQKEILELKQKVYSMKKKSENLNHEYTRNDVVGGLGEIYARLDSVSERLKWK